MVNRILTIGRRDLIGTIVSLPKDKMVAAHLWARSVIVLMLCHLGHCDVIAQGNFSSIVTTIVTGQWGVRTATTSCTLLFPSITVQGGSAFVYTRFDVRVLGFTHYLAYLPNSVTMGSSTKWLIARSDYSYTNQLTFNINFHYSEYLGKGKPTGDCTLFTNMTEALEYADNTPDLTVIEADRLVATDTFQTVYVNTYGVDLDEVVATCRPTFDATLGLYEVYTYVDFTMPVYNVSTVYGTEIVSKDVNSTWYLGRYRNHAISFVDEAYSFSAPHGSSDYTNGFCRVYALTNDTLPGTINFLHGLSTSTTTDAPVYTTTGASTSTTIVAPISTTTMSPTTIPISTTVATTTTATGIITTISTGGTTNVATLTTTATITSTPNSNITPTVFEIIENFTHTGERGMMQEYKDMRYQAVCNVTTLWTMGDTNQLACCRRCLADVDCLSVFYMTVDKSCYAHVDVFTKGDCNMDRISYYVIV